MSRNLKESNIPWITKIPTDWDVIPIRKIAKIRTGSTPSKKDGNDYYSDFNGIPWIKAENLDDEKPISITAEYLTESGAKEGHIFNPYSIFVCCIASVGKVGYSENCCSCNQQINNIAFDDKKMFWKYGYYALRASKEEHLAKANVSVQMILNAQSEGYIKLPYPSIQEQQLIVNFLDHKISNIDEAISRNNQMIEKLEEYKKSVISDTVFNNKCKTTKQVDSTWIKEIPSNWKIVPLKTLFLFSKGLSITKEDLVDNGLNVISYGQIHSKQNTGTKLEDFLIRFVPENFKDLKKSIAHKNGFIFADTSEDLEGCGNCAYIDTDDLIYGGYHTVVLNPKTSNNNKYLAYLFKTDKWRYQIRRELTEVKLYSITQGVLKRMSVLLPPEDEQDEIVKFLDSKCASIDESIKQAELINVKLEEYKKSLIYNAITGKIDCRKELVHE